MKTLKILLSLTLTLNLYALVDYSEPSDNETSAPSVQSKSAPVKSNQSQARATRSSTGPKYIEFKSSFFSHDSAVTAKKVDALSLEAKFETNYDLFLNLEHTFYSGRNNLQNKSVSNESGNTLILLGVHWLEFGQASNALNFDIYAGARLKSKGEFASTRNDKIVGVETAKRFFNTAFSLGYEYTMTGTAEDKMETDVGNISTLFAKLGILVSHDIKFILSAKNVAIASSDNDTSASYLQKTIKYAYLKPELVLNLSDSVGLTLGGVFRTRRPNTTELSSDLRLWSLNGLYGNSIFAGLDFSI